MKSFVKAESEPVQEVPKKSVLASKFQRLEGIYQKLDEQSKAIYEREQQLKTLGEKLTGEKVDDSFKAKLQQKQQEAKEQNRHNEHYKKNDRGAR